MTCSNYFPLFPLFLRSDLPHALENKNARQDPRNYPNVTIVSLCVAHCIHGCEGEVAPPDAHPCPREDGDPAAAPAVTPLQLPQIRSVQRVGLQAHSTNLTL